MKTIHEQTKDLLFMIWWGKQSSTENTKNFYPLLEAIDETFRSLFPS